MNTPTIIVTVLTLWLVMGLGFLSKYADARKNGKSRYEAWKTYEGLLFVLSVVVPVIILIYQVLSN